MTNNQEEWIKEWDKTLGQECLGETLGCDVRNQKLIKAFIRSEKAKSKEEGKREAREEMQIEKMKDWEKLVLKHGFKSIDVALLSEEKEKV